MSFIRQFIVQVPRKMPKHNEKAFQDEKKRTWIKPSDYSYSDFTTWQHNDNTYYVWFKRDTVPQENEVVFGNYKIASIYRFRTLLRCVVEIRSI